MAEKLKDAEDRLLESMFAAEPIADDGFSQRIVTHIRRRVWVRRLALPVAMLVGGLVAFKPAMQLVTVSSTLLGVVPREFDCGRHSRHTSTQRLGLRSSIVTHVALGYIACMNLREQVERLLPNWERWYPSLFDAASDLGLIRAEVCDPNSLLLTRRHAKVRQRAEDAHREKWGGKSNE
jgi:hypothetical protein